MKMDVVVNGRIVQRAVKSCKDGYYIPFLKKDEFYVRSNDVVHIVKLQIPKARLKKYDK